MVGFDGGNRDVSVDTTVLESGLGTTRTSRHHRYPDHGCRIVKVGQPRVKMDNPPV